MTTKRKPLTRAALTRRVAQQSVLPERAALLETVTFAHGAHQPTDGEMCVINPRVAERLVRYTERRGESECWPWRGYMQSSAVDLARRMCAVGRDS